MSFPEELKRLRRWVGYRLAPDKDGGKPRKIPLNVMNGKGAKSNDPGTWTDYRTAKDAAERYGYSGVGFMFAKEDGYVGIDIDHCYDPEKGTFNETARAIMARQNTYMEFSPSGDGVHLFFKGEKPQGISKNTENGVEMYDSTRYFTVTERQVPGSLDQVAEAKADTLSWIHERYVAKKKTAAKSIKQAAGVKLTDEEVITKARNARNGPEFTELWDGKWQGKYPSQSEADMALCMKLAFWTARDEAQMDRLFRQSGLYREKWDRTHHADGSTYGQGTLKQAVEKTTNVYSGGGIASDSGEASGGAEAAAGGSIPIIELNGMYYRVKGDTMRAITNFIIIPIEMIKTEDEAQLTCEFVTCREEHFRISFMTVDLANMQRFKTLLSSKTISLCWFGSEGDLELFKNYLAGLDWPVRYGVKAMGIYEHEGRYFYVCDEGATDARGENPGNLVQLEKYQSIRSSILHAGPLKAEKLKEIGKWLMEYNEPAKTIAILSWAAGCFLKPHMTRLGIKFPHLFLIGEAGSGKSTTLERVILPIFSTEKVTAATQVTPFTLMKESASSNLIPMPLDEFKPSKMDRIRLNALYNHFRDTYDGHDGQRGRADQTMMTYKLLAPLVVAGEESADEAAIRERSIELLFSKKDLRKTEYRLAFNRVQMTGKALTELGRSLLITALVTQSEEVKAWHKEGLALFDQELPSRLINNLACCRCGLKLLERMCEGYRLSWEEVFPVSQAICTKYLEYGAQEYLLDGGSNNKSVVEQTFEVMSRMGLDSGIDYQLNSERTILYIRIRAIYDRYTRYRREYAVAGEILPYDQFRKQLKHSDVLIQAGAQHKFGGKNDRCYVIDYQLLNTRGDVSGFEDEDEIVPLGQGGR